MGDTNTRANWASVNKKDVNDLKTAEGKTAGLKKAEGSKEKCKTPTGDAAAKKTMKDSCDKAKKDVTDNATDIAKIKAYLAQNQKFRADNDASKWWAADISKAQGADSVAADGASLESDAKKRQTAWKATFAAAKTAVGAANLNAAKDGCKVATKPSTQDCLNLEWAKTNMDLVEAHVKTATDDNKNNWKSGTQDWFGTWNTNAIVDADSLIAAKALQATNVADHKTAAAAKPALTNDKVAILATWVTAGNDAIDGTSTDKTDAIKNQNAWHAKSLKACTTKAELATLKAADTKSHTAAVTA